MNRCKECLDLEHECQCGWLVTRELAKRTYVKELDEQCLACWFKPCRCFGEDKNVKENNCE